MIKAWAWLKKQIVDPSREVNEEYGRIDNEIDAGICPYCNQKRVEAHGYINGEEVACPAFACFPNQIKGAA